MADPRRGPKGLQMTPKQWRVYIGLAVVFVVMLIGQATTGHYAFVIGAAAVWATTAATIVYFMVTNRRANH